MMKIKPSKAIAARNDTLNLQDFLNRKIYQQQETAKRNPNSFWLPSYNELIKDLLDLQAMEGVYFCFYKELTQAECDDDSIRDSIQKDLDEHLRFLKAHSGDYL